MSQEERNSRACYLKLYKDLKYISGTVQNEISMKEIVAMVGSSDSFILPRSPLLPLAPSNVFLATPPERKFILQLFKTKRNVADYVEAINTFENSRAKPICI